MKFTIAFIFVFVLVFVLTSDASFAQGLPGLPIAPDQAPIDGGLGLLAAAGGAYAYKKLKNRRRDTDV